MDRILIARQRLHSMQRGKNCADRGALKSSDDDDDDDDADDDDDDKKQNRAQSVASHS